jgi:hypothetical protein
MIVVGNMQFKSKAALERTTRDKLESIGCKTIDANHNEFQFFCDLLNRHRDPKSKMGPGIKGFKITKDQLNKKGFAMLAIQNNGTEIDFSWVRCCSQNWKKEEHLVTEAMRLLTLKTRPYFKNQCELCKTKTGTFEAHHSNISFKRIADQFIKEHPEILDAKLTNGIGTFFHDDSKDIADLWIDYHDTIVRWQYLCKPCHKQQDQKLKVKEQTMNNIQITISAPELVEAMQALTVALQAGAVKPAAVEHVIEKLQDEAKPRKPKAEKPAPTPVEVTEAEAVPEPPTRSITLDEVRVALGNLSQNGKQAEVKKLIASFGVEKLSAIDSDLYGELLAKAEAL